MKIQIFWDVTQCLLLSSYRRFENLLTSGSGETHHQPWIFISTAIRTPHLAFSVSFVVYPSSEQLKLKIACQERCARQCSHIIKIWLDADLHLQLMKYTYKYHANKNRKSAREAQLTDKDQSFVSLQLCVPLASQATPQILCIGMCTIYLHIQFHMLSSNCSSAVVIRPTVAKYFARLPCFIQNRVHRNCSSRITSSRVRRLATHYTQWEI
jgi:hypothetical protein